MRPLNGNLSVILIGAIVSLSIAFGGCTNAPDTGTETVTGTILIDEGANMTAQAAVTLSLTVTNTTGMTQMRFSNDGSDFAASVAFAGTAPWTLSSGDGDKTVYVEFLDGSGNWSRAFNDGILLKTVSSGDPPGDPQLDSRLGAHVLFAQNDGAGTNPAVTPPIKTQASKSTLLALSMGWLRNETSPVDSFGNTWTKLSGPNIYYTPQFSTALWSAPSALGGLGHTLTFNKADYPAGEISIALIEVTDGGKVDQVYALAPASDQSPGSITVDGPATLIAVWGGDSGALEHTAVPDNGFAVIDSRLDYGDSFETGNQIAIAAKQVTSAGTYTVKWTSTPVQNCACYLIAVRKSSP